MIMTSRPDVAYHDYRGDITNVLETPVDQKVRHVTLITSKQGAVRANHVHRHDSHWSYLISGLFEYSARDGGRLETVRITPGMWVYTPPATPHAMRFLEDSVFLAFTTQPRDDGRYDADTSAFKVIEP